MPNNQATRAILLAVALLAAMPARAGQDHATASRSSPPGSSAGLVANTVFVPGADARPALEPFAGTLKLAETAMITVPARFKSRLVLGKQTQLFPAVELSFFTDKGDLVPVTQDVIRAGSRPGAHSFWDLIVQPGRVWSVARDKGWSRAGFPFALVNSLEGETHNGLATFLYRSGEVSGFRFQIVQQTAPYYVEDYFTAAGTVPVTFHILTHPDTKALALIYEASLADNLVVADWRDLARKVGAEKLSGFDGTMAPDDIVLSGLDDGTIFYVKACNSAAGPLPWCDRARFGVWSATKALANSVALLRLAEKYGASVFDLRISDYVPRLAGAPAWRNVRFGDAINMATGVGDGSLKQDPNDIYDGYLDARYSIWYEARSLSEKLAAIAQGSDAYPWGPGHVARYRDQDMFVLGVAMNAFLKAKEGPGADLWTMLEREVFRPIGIHYAPVNRTIEPGGAPGQPIMAFGYFPTIGDMVKIARLYHARGQHQGRQLLYAARIDELIYGTTPRGLPTGEKNRFGETAYFNAFWEARYDSPEGCRLYIPRMLGFGGNLIALMPGGFTGIRISKSLELGTPAVMDTTGMAAAANRMTRFCRVARVQGGGP